MLLPRSAAAGFFRRFRGFALLVCCLMLLSSRSEAAPPAAELSEAELLRIIQQMSEQLRARADKLPVLVPADQAVGTYQEQQFTLNRKAVEVEGQRFDGLVVVAPKTKASFGWAFVSPPNVASWYILREKGEMQGFSNFERRPRSNLPGAAALKPTDVETVRLQALNSTHWQPGERYIIWFRFNDDKPASFSARAGFFATGSLTNARLPALLFPANTAP